MDASEFLLDPTFCFDPYLTQLTDIDQASVGIVQSDYSAHLRRTTRIRASRACIQCRSRHMKCDSIEPNCTRCQLDGKTCVYIKSRRGGSNRIDPPENLHKRVFPRSLGPSSPSHSNFGTDSTTSPGETSSGTLSNLFYSDFTNTSETYSAKSQDSESLINRYYEYFHNAHPMILPRRFLLSRRHRDAESLDFLLPVLEYIGAIYTPDVSTDPFLQQVHDKLNSSNLPSNGFSVQALTLLSIGLHCSDEYKLADEYLDKAMDIALSIKMHHQDFAVENGEGDSVLQESWRRTWWSLYMCDVLFAAINHCPTHRMRDIGEGVELPCEDAEYEAGHIPTPRTLFDYDNREFSDEEIVFSSFTYLVDVMRIASSVMNINLEDRQPGDGVLASTDAKLVNWALFLPKCKQELVKDDQSVDETMFFAHLALNSEKLLLHRPYSRLLFSDIETQSKCTPPSPKRQSKEVQRSIAMHTAKCLEVIDATINLFALPTPQLKHSPINSCSLALAVMAHVSACNHVLRPGSNAYKSSRDKIRLGLGALKTNTECWGMARRSVREVVGVARELLSISTPSASKSTGRTYEEEMAFPQEYVQEAKSMENEETSYSEICTTTMGF